MSEKREFAWTAFITTIIGTIAVFSLEAYKLLPFAGVEYEVRTVTTTTIVTLFKGVDGTGVPLFMLVLVFLSVAFVCLAAIRRIRGKGGDSA